MECRHSLGSWHPLLSHNREKESAPPEGAHVASATTMGREAMVLPSPLKHLVTNT